MRVAICDDEELIRIQINKYLCDFFTKNHLNCPEIAMFEDGESLLMDSEKKDIVFLDVEMPGLKGIHVGKELRKANKNIIIFIISAFPEYLDDAMRFHVFRYLSKPIEKHRFFHNLKDALQLYNTTSAQIPIETKEGFHIIASTNIVAIEALARKVIVHTLSQKYESVQTMAYWMTQLKDNCFFQTHRSFIVNMMHVNGFNHELVYLHNNQVTAYLTKRKYTEFKNTYLLYIESTR